MKTLDLYKLKSPCRPCICGADGQPVEPFASPKLRQHRDQVVADFWGKVFAAPTPITVEYEYQIVPEQPYPLAVD